MEESLHRIHQGTWQLTQISKNVVYECLENRRNNPYASYDHLYHFHGGMFERVILRCGWAK